MVPMALLTSGLELTELPTVGSETLVAQLLRLQEVHLFSRGHSTQKVIALE